MSKKSQYTKEDCLKSLRSAAKDLGYSPDVKSYIGNGFAPCYSTILHRFGSWKTALAEAGLGPPPSTNVIAAKARRMEKTGQARRLLRQQAIEIMRGEMASGLTPEEIADRAGTTPAKLRRAFSADNGSTPGAELAAMKVERAATLLRTQDLSVSDVAEKVGYSYNGLIRVFTKLRNESPSQYQRRLRMEHAAKLLVEQPHLTAKEIARITGPVDGHDFNKVFRRFYGMSPLSYRKMMLAERGAEISAHKERQQITA